MSNRFIGLEANGNHQGLEGPRIMISTSYEKF